MGHLSTTSCLTSVSKRKHRVESVPKHVVSNFYYNWHCGMAMGFNGTPYPSDYPREVYDVGSLTYKGEHLSFQGLVNYCKLKGITYDE